MSLAMSAPETSRPVYFVPVARFDLDGIHPSAVAKLGQLPERPTHASHSGSQLRNCRKSIHKVVVGPLTLGEVNYLLLEEIKILSVEQIRPADLDYDS